MWLSLEIATAAEFHLAGDIVFSSCETDDDYITWLMARDLSMQGAEVSYTVVIDAEEHITSTDTSFSGWSTFKY